MHEHCWRTRYCRSRTRALAGRVRDQIGQILTMVQTKGPEVITNFCNGITAALPTLIAQGAMLLNNLLQAITANLPAIISGGISIVSTLISGIAQQLPTLTPDSINDDCYIGMDRYFPM